MDSSIIKIDNQPYVSQNINVLAPCYVEIKHCTKAFISQGNS